MDISSQRSKAGKLSALSRWGQPRGRASRLCVEKDVKSMVEKIPIEQRTRIVSETLRKHLPDMIKGG